MRNVKFYHSHGNTFPLRSRSSRDLKTLYNFQGRSIAYEDFLRRMRYDDLPQSSARLRFQAKRLLASHLFPALFQPALAPLVIIKMHSQKLRDISDSPHLSFAKAAGNMFYKYNMETGFYGNFYFIGFYFFFYSLLWK